MTSRRSYETRNRVCDMLLKVAGPYAPSHVIILYYNRLEQRFVRAVEGISNFDTLRLVLWEDDMPDHFRRRPHANRPDVHLFHSHSGVP